MKKRFMKTKQCIRQAINRFIIMHPVLSELVASALEAMAHYSVAAKFAAYIAHALIDDAMRS